MTKIYYFRKTRFPLVLLIILGVGNTVPKLTVAQSLPDNDQEQKRATELYKAEQEKVDKRIKEEIKERKEKDRIYDKEFNKSLDDQKRDLEKALIAAAPEEKRLKKRWLEWTKISIKSKKVIDIHTTMYNDSKDAKEKSRDAENLRVGNDLFKGLSLYARDLLTSPEADFVSGINEIVAFREVIFQGKGLGNLMLADWSNQLIYSLICARCISPQGIPIAVLKNQIPKLHSVWGNWDGLVRILNDEFAIEIKYHPVYMTKPENGSKKVSNGDFDYFHPIGQKITFLSQFLNDKGIFDKVENLLKRKDASKLSILDQSMYLFLLVRLRLRGDIFNDYIDKKYELDQFCDFLISHPKVSNLDIKKKYDLDEPDEMPVVSGLPYKPELYKHGGYNIEFDQGSLFALWKDSQYRLEDFQKDKMVNIAKMYFELADMSTIYF